MPFSLISEAASYNVIVRWLATTRFDIASRTRRIWSDSAPAGAVARELVPSPTHPTTCSTAFIVGWCAAHPMVK